MEVCVRDTRYRTDCERLDSIKAFGQLRTEITRLTTDSCSGFLADDLPTYIKDQIPEDLPDFSASSRSSIRLRASYIHHLICRTLNLRIFQPFLFTLDRHQGATDPLFEEWSNRLQKLSPKREAIWRQHTLQAAYTARTAKQAINQIAGQLVAEMSGEIKYFVPSLQAEAVRSALKGIVKLAIETWRHARLEKGMVIASMSCDLHPSIIDAGVTSWAIPASRNQSDMMATHIITTFPFVGKIEMQHNRKLDTNGETCIYSKGSALYQDSPSVVERLAEIHQGSTNPHSFPERNTGPQSQGTRPTDLGESSATRNEGSSSQTTTSRPSRSSLSDQTILSTLASPMEEALPDWRSPLSIARLKNNISW